MHTLSTMLPLCLALGCGSSPGASGHDATPPADSRASDAAPTPDAATCGTRAGMRGLTHRTAMVAGLRRTYAVYLPDSPATTPLPLVLVFHGYTMSGQSMIAVTQYQAIADRDHVAVAFPDGQAGPDSAGAPWNVGSDVCPSTAGPPPDATGDDFAFIDAMKSDIATDQCLDPAHVFVTGFSMGGYFTHEVGCHRSDVRAIAPHSGGTHPLDACPVAHVPVILFHGTADPLVPAGCQDPSALPVLGVTAAAAAWAAHNGCATTTTSRAVQNGTCVDYDACPADGQVELCTFQNMGHCWAGGPASAGVYACPGYASATDLEWSFFQQHAW